MDSDSDNSDDSVSVGGSARDFSEEDSDSVSSEDNSESESSDDAEEEFRRDMEGIKNNDPRVTELEGGGHDARGEPLDFIQNISNEQWEEIGRDISNNTHLERLELNDGALNDEKMSFLFRGLTRSSSIEKFYLNSNELSIAGLQSMVPFLHNATNNLRMLDLDGNNIQSEGFNFLCRALQDSPIQALWCNECGIESIEIDIDHFPRQLKALYLSRNSINAGGCREIVRLLQGGYSTLEHLFLSDNNVDDEGVAVLVESLRNNSTLRSLQLWRNDITEEGLVTLLKLLNDISSIQSTLQSNHTLSYIYSDEYDVVRHHIDMARKINENHSSDPEEAGREKVIRTQLHSVNRAALAKLQGVSHSLYSEINPLHLPEVLSLVGRSHGQRELYVALKSSIEEVISIVDRKHCIECIDPRLDNLGKTKSMEPHSQREGIVDEGEGAVTHAGNGPCSKKRRRGW